MTDCDGSVDVELSGMSTAFLVYISQIEPIMQGIHFPDNSHPGTRYQSPRSMRLDNFFSRLYGSRRRWTALLLCCSVPATLWRWCLMVACGAMSSVHSWPMTLKGKLAITCSQVVGHRSPAERFGLNICPGRALCRRHRTCSMPKESHYLFENKESGVWIKIQETGTSTMSIS